MVTNPIIKREKTTKDSIERVILVRSFICANLDKNDAEEHKKRRGVPAYYTEMCDLAIQRFRTTYNLKDLGCNSSLSRFVVCQFQIF